jgi:hypothetical protein
MARPLPSYGPGILTVWLRLAAGMVPVIRAFAGGTPPLGAEERYRCVVTRPTRIASKWS